jgi:lipopolysaccharide/colanic/teichoic acid biosynthesis glycosyltransferase
LKRKIGAIVATVAGAVVTMLYTMMRKEIKTSYTVQNIEALPLRKMGFYEKYIKRIIDIVCALAAIICFSPIYIGVAILVKIKLGSPVLFTQDRPGLVNQDGKETIFKMYKFRTMTDEKDENGDLLPDEKRLTPFGKWLRSTSLDELPEVFNILNGTLSVCGPRPQLVRDMIFMTNEQRMRHTAKPGLSGLAQVNGRNSIKWEDKLDWDLKYIQKVSLLGDLRIVLKTVKTAFIKQEGITDGDMATAEDLGDYLLRIGKISNEEYKTKQKITKSILKKSGN